MRLPAMFATYASLIVGTLTVGTLIASTPSWAQKVDRNKGKAPVVAVFPFKVLNSEEKWKHLGEGASDGIINKIVNDRALKIVEESQLDKAVSAIARNQSGLFEEDSAIAVGQMVDARFIVIGSVQVVGDDKTGQVKVNARVLEVETRQLLVSESVFGPLAAAFQQYDEIAARLVSKMTYHLAQRVNSGETADSLAVRQLIDEGKAYDTAFTEVPGVQKDMNRATALYNKAVLRDPKSAVALRALGHAESRQSDTFKNSDPNRSRNLLTAARDHLKKSAELDGNNAFTWNELGRCEGRLNHHPAARIAFEKALAVDPNYVAARFGLAVALFNAGQLDTAREQAAMARAAGDGRAEGLLGQIDTALASRTQKPDPKANR